MALEEFPSTNFNTRGGLAVYGPGTDGNVIITGTVVLNRDMYYNNLTVMGGAQLDTNGYRVFVKNTLNMVDASSVIGRLADTTSIGSLLGGAAAGIKASDTLGGSGGLNPGENFFGEAEFYNFSQAIAGYKFDAVSGTLRFLMGGSGGASGGYGASGGTGSFTLGEAGESGSAGLPGTRPGFEYTVGASGGMGYPGNPGNPGNPGIGGIGGEGGSGGTGGAGGGVVIVSARKIIGSGIIRADGKSGDPGNPGLPGSPGSTGSPGTQGEPGLPAPDFYSASYLYVSQPAYNYAVEYSFTNPTTGGAARRTYTTIVPGYSFFYPGPPYLIYLTAYNAATSYAQFNRPTTTYTRPTTTYARPSYGSGGKLRPGAARTTPGNARTAPGNRGTVFNQSTVYYFTAYAPGSPEIAYNNPTGGTARTTYTAIVPGYISYAYNYQLQPDQYAIEPEHYYVGGAGGVGGLGGAGGVGSAGLPGSPGINGYAGGGGVVLVVTEEDIPESIDVRASAGTGDGGFATSGTVIIIKNEVVEGVN